MWRVVLAGIVFISLLITVLTFSKTQIEKPNPLKISTNYQSSVVIKYSNGVFDPVTTTIKTGQSIEFRNVGTDILRVALGKGPDHEEVEGFEETNLLSGKSYYFTTQQAGIFDFHNHLLHSARGTLIVE